MNVFKKISIVFLLLITGVQVQSLSAMEGERFSGEYIGFTQFEDYLKALAAYRSSMVVDRASRRLALKSQDNFEKMQDFNRSVVFSWITFLHEDVLPFIDSLGNLEEFGRLEDLQMTRLSSLSAEFGCRFGDSFFRGI